MVDDVEVDGVMVDEVMLDFATAAACAGLSIPELESLVASGAMVVDRDRIAQSVVVAWSEDDRASRRGALAALAAGIGAEVFY